MNDATSSGEMTEPTFLIIGAQKAATTWLANALEAHPEVFTSARKELHYFDNKERHANGPAWYRSHFAGATEQHRAVGEATPNYLWVTSAVPPEVAAHGFDAAKFGAAAYPGVNSDTPTLIRDELPDVKLIVILRNPVERSVSAFNHHIRKRRIAPWSRILDVGDRNGILGMSFYDAHIERWFEVFDPERFLVLGFEDEVIAQPEQAVAKALRHIGVDDRFVPTRLTDKKNERASGPFLYANYFAPKVATRLFAGVPELHDLPWPRVTVTDDDRRRMADLFAPGIERLEKHVGRPFPAWR
jgi:Sulfotransferase family